MTRAIACVLGVAVLVGGDGGRAVAQNQPRKASAPAPQPASPAREVPVGEFLIAQPLQCKNLTVFPVLSTAPKNEDRYVTLEEGLNSGKINVYEVGAQPAGNSRSQPQPRNAQQAPLDESADVNHLMVINRSIKPLYLMPGEIIYGGKQDRCVAKECVIPDDGKPVKIDVYCVEHGRWASGGSFGGKAGNLGKSGRAAVQEGKGQQEVWDDVRAANAASGVRPATGAFTANYTDPRVLNKIDSYVKDIERPLAERRQVVGAIVAVNGKIEVVDVFGSTPLFRKVWPKLLKGYALDAAVAASKKTKKDAQPPTLKNAEEFLRSAMESSVQQKTSGTEGLVVTKRESKGVVSYSAAERSKVAPSAMGGFGGSLHSSGYSK